MARDLFSVGVDVFVVRDNKLLLGKRNHGYCAGTWGLPGGHLELKEATQECAARELLEETGIVTDGFDFLSVINNTKHTQTHYIHFSFLAKNPKGEAKVLEPDRIEEWRWFPLSGLPKDIFPPHITQIELFLSKKSNFADI